jgi:Uma2 family endonuclease
MSAMVFAEVLRPEPMTLEAWADMDEDEPGELVDGQLVEEEVTTNEHELIAAWFTRNLGNWGSRCRALVLGSEHKLAVSKTRGRKPDVCVYAPGQRLTARASLSRTPPMMIIEIISSRPRDVRRDRSEKVDEYARFGVRWYWLIDPVARLLEILELAPDGRYIVAKSVGEGQLEVPGCEGLVLDLSALWGEVDAHLTDEDDDETAESGEQ